MRKYIIRYESGAEVTKKFHNDSEAIAFVYDPRHLHTFGDMELLRKSDSGSYSAWDKNKRTWVDSQYPDNI